MGTFIGHVYPGLFLYLYGLYQATVVSKAMLVNGSLLNSSCPSRNKGRWARLWEISHRGLLKMVTGSILIAYEISCTKGGLALMSRELPPRFMYPKQWQHLTMFTLLTLSGCVDVTSRNLLPHRRVLLERGALVLTFYVLLLLLLSHVQGSTGVELQVHCLLILVVFLLLLVLTVQLWAPHAAHLSLIEAFLFLMMGSWLMQAGFVLYRPVTGYPWEDDDISDVMFVTTFFCWHVMINALCLLGIYGASSCWHRWSSPCSKLTRSKEAPYYSSSEGPIYRLLLEGECSEHSEKDDPAHLLPESSP